MGRVVSIGTEGFAELREQNYFYVDKTNFIKAWCEEGDHVTLISRPRGFGKTLNMDIRSVVRKSAQEIQCLHGGDDRRRCDGHEHFYK